ncbi:phosphoribosylanthranilate isomerase [Methylocella sp.]|uniref:phosphoribosylanthranilate isomerase n=1 Tax=Methylocella sp. TaxID=1978226 RepID=UPI00378404CB
MTRSPIVKICGVTTPEAVDAALSAGADMLGFVIFEKSPRHLSLDVASRLAARVGLRAARVLLTVDAPDDLIAAATRAVEADFLQLHGHEPPERVAALRAAFDVKIIKALPVASPADLAAAAPYEQIADMLLFDAKAPPGAALPGGNGASFDWRILQGLATARPWLVAGGLDAANVAEALRVSGAPGVDVSSGVERAPGVKDEAMIAAFLRAARGLDAPARVSLARGTG